MRRMRPAGGAVIWSGCRMAASASMPERGHQPPGLLRSAAMRADGPDRREHVVEGARIQREDLGGAAQVVQRLAHMPGRQRADSAQVLGEDQLRVEGGQGVGVQCVQVQVPARGQFGADVGVDLARAHPRGVAPADNHRGVPPGGGKAQ